MSYNTKIQQNTFGTAWQDGSISAIRDNADGSVIVGLFEYGSDLVPAFLCANEETLQYFVHRFSNAIDCWHDVFAVGPIMKFTLKHQPANSDGDIADQRTSEIELSFSGWFVAGDYETLHTDLDQAIEVLNRPIDLK